MKQILRISEAAKMLGLSASSLRRYEKDGLLTSHRTPGGHRYYTLAQVEEFKDDNLDLIKEPGNTVFYVRSSDSDEVKINNQITLLINSYGAPTRVYKDKASGLNEKRQGLLSLINNVKKGKIDTIIITQKDRLTRFGFTYLEELFNAYGVELIVHGETENKDIHEELLQDFMSLLASFSGKFYRLRGHEQRKELLKKAGEELDKTHQ
jgi:putative resolvase